MSFSISSRKTALRDNTNSFLYFPLDVFFLYGIPIKYICVCNKMNWFVICFLYQIARFRSGLFEETGLCSLEQYTPWKSFLDSSQNASGPLCGVSKLFLNWPSSFLVSRLRLWLLKVSLVGTVLLLISLCIWFSLDVLVMFSEVTANSRLATAEQFLLGEPQD